MAPLRRAFLEKRHHSFADILGLQQLAAVNFFRTLEGLIKILPRQFPQALQSEPQNCAAFAEKLVHERVQAVVKFRRAEYAIDQADRSRFVRWESAAGENHFRRAVIADQRRKSC